MKKSLLLAAGFGIAVVSLLSGCVEHRVVYVPTPTPAVPADTAVVYQAPPPPSQEVVVAAPGPAYAWVPGYWSWQGRWVWIGGRYVVRPHPRAVLVPGHWARHGGGYIWVSGYWR